MNVGAIETKHNGLAFRSRLEARWAVFFDVLGVAYQYEPEGYEANNQRYLPDFWLPGLQAFAEVKGNRLSMFKDMDRVFSVVEESEFLRGTKGLVLLGDIPRLEWGMAFHPLLKHEGEAPIWTLCWFSSNSLVVAQKRDEHWIRTMTGEDANKRGWEPQPLELRTHFAYPLVLSAYEKARQERF